MSKCSAVKHKHAQLTVLNRESIFQGSRGRAACLSLEDSMFLLQVSVRREAPSPHALASNRW
jgi:hypothetical protein